MPPPDELWCQAGLAMVKPNLMSSYPGKKI
jgi:hypothetical protein